VQLEGLRGEKLRLEIRQRELEQEWDAARTRVYADGRSSSAWAASRCRIFANRRGHAEVDRAQE